MKIIFGLILALTLLFGGYLFLDIIRPTDGDVAKNESSASNVHIVDGVQKIDLTAKGGYLPKVSTAKAGIPTVLSVDTNGTFDCSSALRIPSLKVSESLPMTGTTEIALGTLSPGVIHGSCGMGMYPFEINVTEE